MTPALRKYHRRFWFVAAFILPLLFAAAVIVIPEPVTQSLAQEASVSPLEVIIAQGEHPQFSAYLRSDHQNIQRQIEIVLNKPFNSPETIVYLTSTPESPVVDDLFLGKLSSAGHYHFAVPSTINSGSIQIYDPFSDSVIAGVTLNPIQ